MCSAASTAITPSTASAQDWHPTSPLAAPPPTSPNASSAGGPTPWWSNTRTSMGTRTARSSPPSALHHHTPPKPHTQQTSTSQMTTPYRYSPSSAAPHETSADLPHPAAHHHPSEGQREHLSTPAPGRPPGPRTPASVPAQDVAGTTHIREAHRPPGFTHRLRTPTVSGHPVSGHPQSPDSLGPGRPCASGRPGRGPSARRFPNLSNHVANGHMVLSRRDK
mmetsp:Transcript_15762/g.38665  ORF Transcript_15762/g.38665 Transcript_15762/m.38665 type:complete len:221 (-) Transcript_15762:645-1307(-)